MSWFDDIPLAMREADDDEREGSELADGVVVERREVLKLSLGALALLSLGLPQRMFAAEGGAGELKAKEGELAWDTLIKKVVPLAEALVKEKQPNEQAYLMHIASLVARLDKTPEAKFREGLPVAAARHYRKMPFVVLQFKLQPGASIPFHDHRDYNGILSSVAGEARVRSFDIEGDDPRPAAGKSFLIRETGNRILTPGRMSHLSRTRDNIHDVKAGKEGARLLDFFTFFNAAGTSKYLNVANKPKDAEKRTFEASWK